MKCTQRPGGGARKERSRPRPAAVWRDVRTREASWQACLESLLATHRLAADITSALGPSLDPEIHKAWPLSLLYACSGCTHTCDCCGVVQQGDERSFQSWGSVSWSWDCRKGVLPGIQGRAVPSKRTLCCLWPKEEAEGETGQDRCSKTDRPSQPLKLGRGCDPEAGVLHRRFGVRGGRVKPAKSKLGVPGARPLQVSQGL